jgi:hypothetical protein
VHYLCKYKQFIHRFLLFFIIFILNIYFILHNISSYVKASLLLFLAELAVSWSIGFAIYRKVHNRQRRKVTSVMQAIVESNLGNCELKRRLIKGLLKTLF